ncbi:zinc finger protein 449-like isoform X2 [Leptidea sinapis]|uniref:zinc finger protein 449-like isoform X2 n=1 Tax=Leptidea sinapis TaxID=189913 RepID=UPI0021C3E633|nr:zinc finger protein 449-like isoform X2 [Leptidea sinapis]
MDMLSGQRNCEEGEMNFAFSTVGGSGTHYVTTSGQMPKMQQNTSNCTQLPQVVGMVGGVNMGDGVQYIRTLDGTTTLQATPQFITVPIQLPGTKPGDPQPTVQIQVLSPNLALQQQQHKYQMQIPIQGFQQGGAVLTVAYSPESNEASNGIQLLGNTLPEGLQVVTAMPSDTLQLMQQDNKEQIQQNLQHQVFITPNNQIIISNTEEGKSLINNNTSINNKNEMDIVIKEECNDDDESSQGTENSDGVPWKLEHISPHLVKYLNTLPPQQTQALPVSLQQFLRLNPTDSNKSANNMVQIEISPLAVNNDAQNEVDVELEGEDAAKKKKKKTYKKKPAAPPRPKPGSVVISMSTDGVPIYCCPQCTSAYTDKEQLELHLASHKIERRFICGICGAGLKRKEHLERHKLGHNPERPFVCTVCGKGFKRREHLNLHVVIHSGVKREMCGECGKGFYRKDHLRKHTRSHESKRAKEGANCEVIEVKSEGSQPTHSAEITIHVPTSSNMQVPVHINIPQHVMSSIAAAQSQPVAATDTQLDALLAQHS